MPGVESLNKELDFKGTGHFLLPWESAELLWNYFTGIFLRRVWWHAPGMPTLPWWAGKEPKCW